jgi:hypothetical protein
VKGVGCRSESSGWRVMGVERIMVEGVGCRNEGGKSSEAKY